MAFFYNPETGLDADVPSRARIFWVGETKGRDHLVFATAHFFFSMSDTKSKAFTSLCCWYVLCFPLSAVGDDGDRDDDGFAVIIDGFSPPNMAPPV